MSEVWIDLYRTSVEHQEMLAGIWNEACGDDLALSPDVVEFNLEPEPGGKQMGWFVTVDDGDVVAFVSATVDGVEQSKQDKNGWIDAMAVKPSFQRRKLGGKLLDKAETWLIEQGCSIANIGCSFHAFVAGLPAELQTDDFFEQAGYQPREGHPYAWDVAANLGEFSPSAVSGDCEVRPGRTGDEALLLAFLEREFPGRWTTLSRLFLDEGGRIADFMLLWTERGVDGFCHLTFEDSLRPVARHYPFRLPRPWGHLGPIGVSADTRGQGFGEALMNAGLRRLHDNGVNGCVIDWTTITGFYAKFGFQKFRTYHQKSKRLSDE